MKNVFVFIVAGLAFSFSSCNSSENANNDNPSGTDQPSLTFPDLARDMTIYEVNIRQHTIEGTFNAFTKDLPRIASLGTEILWIMPIQPIGEKNRKGELGSYYSIKDYTAVNPEFGTFEDFTTLVSEAHKLGLYVILDWVPNHTAWDHPWVSEHPEYYAKDSLGQITYEADWIDIALLDYSALGLGDEMIDKMRFWVEEANIDGFRCDHAAHEIPMSFWDKAIPALDSLKNLFWLAEWDEPKLHGPFHASYYWGGHHLTKEVAHKQKPASELIQHALEDQEKYGKSTHRLGFITNHDENAWSGTVDQLYGDQWKLFAVFNFTGYGMPMIYSGQEAGLDKQLKFFEKDTIDWSDPRGQQEFYRKLVQLHKENPALWSGRFGGTPEIIPFSNAGVLAYKRSVEQNEVLVVLNFTEETIAFELNSNEDTYEDYFEGQKVSVSEGISVPAVGFKVFIKK